MTQPLAIVLYEKLLPGSQLVNRLQDLKYRVRAISDAESLVACAEQEGPMLVFVDLAGKNVPQAVQRLRQNSATSHLPVIAFGPEDSSELQQAALAAGAVLATTDTAILGHLPEFLEQALRLE